MNDGAFELYNNMLIAADMVKNLEDREVIYATMRAARIAVENEGHNPRQMFVRQARSFPHIELDMTYKNWDD